MPTSRQRSAPLQKRRQPILVFWIVRAVHHSKIGHSCPLWVSRDRGGRSRTSKHVRFAPKADKRTDVWLSPLCATSGCEQSQQSSPYSITLSARSTRPAGTSWPIAFASCRLTTNSNLVGRSTGRSAGFAPRRIHAPYRYADTHLVSAVWGIRLLCLIYFPRECKTAGAGVGDADAQSTETYHEDAHHCSSLRDRHSCSWSH
jgi:hypothetical protein